MRKRVIQISLILIISIVSVSALVRSQESAEAGVGSTPPSIELETAGRVGSHVVVVNGADGSPLLAYHDETRGDLKVTKCLEPSCAARADTVVVDSDGRVGSYVSMAIDGTGLPVLSYLDAGTGDLKVARCSAPDCSGTATISRVDTGGVVGLFTSIAIGSDGMPVISYFDRDRCALKVAKCKDPSCSGGDAVVSTVDKKGCVGLFSSLAISADGAPVIAYYDADEGRLKAAKCTDSACAGGRVKISVVDESVSVGSFARVAIGSSGLPLISYYDHSRGDLKLAVCNDPACSGGDESIVSLDTVGLVGSYATLGIGVDQRPIVAYYDLPNGVAKVVRCKDPDCEQVGSPQAVAKQQESMISFLAMTITSDEHAAIAFFDEAEGDLELVRLPLSSVSP